MKQVLLILVGALVFGAMDVMAQTQQVVRCGMPILQKAMIAKDPSWADKFKAQKASLQAIADNYIQQKASGTLERTTNTISPVPVIYHIVVDSAQFNALGGTAGIIKRCDSQIAVLNRDYNKQNADSTLIPSSWKPLYANVGIHFGLAHKDPSGNCSPGYEVLIVSNSDFSNVNEAYPEAKTAGTGLPAWDITKYYNVWCINFAPLSGGGTLLGITVPLSWAASYPANNVGVCILYNTLGTQTTGAGSFFAPFNLGRTLSHETGHFFEIWHPWGDDNGACPWSGGSDDGLSDTPPEADYASGNPTYTITGGTIPDGCQMHGSTNVQPIGIACLSYLDYTDDDAMHMFTNMQAGVMASMALVPPGSSGTTADGYGTVGEHYNLTQNPDLLVSCTVTGVTPSPTEVNSSLSVYPNPTTGLLTVSVNSAAETLKDIVVINLLGQQVMTVTGQNKDYYSIDLSGMSKGIYFVKCNFASGSVVRKILLQ